MQILKTMAVLFLAINLTFGQESENLCSKMKIEYLSKSQLFKQSQVKYPGDNSYDVQYYKLNLSVTYSPQLVSGTVTMTAISSTNGLQQIFLDLADNFQVKYVRMNGKSVSFTRGSNKINITLDSVYNTGKMFSVDVMYSGTPQSNGFGSFEFTTYNSHPVIWSFSEPYGAKDWWPCKDDPADKADSADIILTTVTSMTPVSNGKLIEVTDNQNGTHTYHWKTVYPIANYLISLAITDYKLYKNYFVYNQADTMEVLNYNYFDRLTPTRINELNKTINMLEVFSDKYGLYPFINEKYGHAEFGWSGGMEHQTCTSIGAYFTDVISHELAHQWFGDKITCKDWHHIWLNEGFATYSESVYKEEVNGYSAYKSSIQNEMTSAFKALGSIYVQDISSVNQIFDGNRSYAKGAVVLHMLRGIVGKETFFNILRTYLEDPELAYGVATTEDFQQIAEKVSGKDLDYFFQEWIYGEKYPTYTVDWSYSQTSDQSYGVKLNIKQQANKKPSFFTMPVQIKIKTEKGDTLITVFNNQLQQEFDITLSAKPLLLYFDPENWIMKKVSSVTSVHDENIQPQKFYLEQNYPNPFNPSTTIQYSIPSVMVSLSNHDNGGVTLRQAQSDIHVSLKVYDILGNEVATLVNENKPAGNYEVKFDGSNLTSGIYFYKLQSGSFTQTKKLLLLK